MAFSFLRPPELLRSVSPADSTPGLQYGRVISTDRTGLTHSSCYWLPAKVTCNRLAIGACWPAIYLIAHRVDFTGPRNQAPCSREQRALRSTPEGGSRDQPLQPDHLQYRSKARCQEPF